MITYQLGCDHCGRDLNKWFVRVVFQEAGKALTLSPVTDKYEAVFCSVEHLKYYLENNGTGQ